MIGIIFIIIYFGIVAFLGVTCFLKERKAKSKADVIDVLFYGYSVLALLILTFLLFWLLDINERLKERTAEYRQEIEEIGQEVVEIKNKNLGLEKMPGIVENTERELWQCTQDNITARKNEEESRKRIKKENEAWKAKEQQLERRVTELEAELLGKTKGDTQEAQPESAIQ